ncbi:hypothetical protein AX14_005643 [Amanita brunnescens Koide BX004]|nr:hypothetical protein AX14_005643 [Amanita brunnescens Koide BX004]
MILPPPHYHFRILALNSIALATAIIGNNVLLMNFARRIRYKLAQPTTIFLWYISATAHIVALCVSHTIPGANKIFSQAYYYALIACTIHLLNATMLLISVLPTLRWPIFKTTFPAYAPHMLLTAPQRTLMFQTLIFTLYLALGAGIFSSIEGWTYLDGIYWTNYSLLTIGFGSDFTPSSPASRIVLVPYTAAGIFILGLVVTSIRALFVARFRERVVWGKEIVQIQRKQWWRAQMGYVPRPSPLLFWRARNPRKFGNSKIPTLQAPTKWSREEWEVMRYVKKRADDRRRYLSLLTTFSVFVVIWFGGALLFWFTERHQDQQAGKYTYPLSLYFTYVSLTTIGYGDVLPKSRAGRPVFVAWSLAAIPSVTLLISDIGDTLAKWVKEGPIEGVVGRWLIGTVDISYEGLDDEEDQAVKRDGPRSIITTEKPPVAAPDAAKEQGYKNEARKCIKLLEGIRTILHDDEKKRYTWEEWREWIRLLELHKDSGSEEGDVANWTWMGDDGPLFARGESEKLWVLDHIRQRLFEKMEVMLK